MPAAAFRKDGRALCRSRKQRRSCLQPLRALRRWPWGFWCALVSWALTAPKTIRVADYAEPVPSTFRMKADVAQADGMLLIDGYALHRGRAL